METYQEMRKQLFHEQKHACRVMSEAEVAAADAFAEGYKTFLDNGKTEREAVATAVEMAESRGFTEFDDKKVYRAGDKIYYNNRGKQLFLVTVGTEPLEAGLRIMAAHIDSPRLDLKPNPLYEDEEICFFKTHYYGGIKKYQWTTIPLSMHGVISRRDGTNLTVRYGDADDEPKFVITDLLPHLADEQMKKTAREVISGEALNILVGSRPFKDDEESQSVKLAIAKLLFDKYGITESDFLSAELCFVPAYRPVDIGFDRSMIGAYGHDDKVCAYPALMAAFYNEHPAHTLVTVLADKEETGSEGPTGMQSRSFNYLIESLALSQGTTALSVLTKSTCLSADVTAAFDPQYPETMEKRNASYLNKGVAVMKYGGARGKSSTTDASAEFMGEVRRMLDEEGVVWQTGELGRVDLGGGGTVAKYVARFNVDAVDIGVPVLSMHAPMEVISKLDLYSTYRAFVAFAK